MAITKWGQSDEATGVAEHKRWTTQRGSRDQQLGRSRDNATPLHEWVALFTSGVTGLHALVNAAIVTWWPNDLPFTVWEMVAALSASAIGALIVGILTVFITWETSQHFGRLSADEIAEQLQESLATTLGSAGEFLNTAVEFLQYAEANPGAIVIIALPDEHILSKRRAVGVELAASLQRRFATDERTSLVLPARDKPSGLIWDRLALVATNSSLFRERFTTRRSIVTTVPVVSEAVVVVLVPSGIAGTFSVAKSALAFPVQTNGAVDYAGIRSEVDRAFGQMILERFLALVQEPTSPYSKDVLSAKDLLNGRYTGVPVTRAIITSQLIQAAETVQDLDTTPDFTIKILSPLDPNKTIQFFYSTSCFCPPLHSGQNHSGSVLANVLSNELLPVVGAKIWEVGCGPGYVTLLLAEKVGPTGKIIATDIDEDASRIAKKNITNSEREDRVIFVAGDCRDFNLAPDPADPMGTVLTTPAGDKHLIDIIFIELPLLPYCGARVLSASEQGYFESAEASRERMLPPSLVKLLELVRHGRGEQLQLIVPVAGEGADLDFVVGEILDLLGTGWVVDPLRVAEPGFIVPLHIHS